MCQEKLKGTSEGTAAVRCRDGADGVHPAVEKALQTVIARNLDPIEQGVVSVTEFITGGIRNAIPGNVTLKGDTRSYSPTV